jgi:hypothetical protein
VDKWPRTKRPPPPSNFTSRASTRTSGGMANRVSFGFEESGQLMLAAVPYRASIGSAWAVVSLCLVVGVHGVQELMFKVMCCLSFMFHLNHLKTTDCSF